jgi:hypothetical protein
MRQTFGRFYAGSRGGIMPRVTLAQVHDLEAALAAYHATHANSYGPQETCFEVTCVEGKWAIAWLKERAISLAQK